MTRMLITRTLITLCVLLTGMASGKAQAVYAATGPGSYLSVGITASAFRSDYGKRTVDGPALYLDANVYRRIGMEAEVRSLRFHDDTGVRQTTYLIGPKISTHGRSMRPYAKLLAGRGEFKFPFGYAEGSYFVAAPGAGLDWRLGHSGRVVLRVIDFEYQLWPQFTFGALHPYGISSGFSFDVMRMVQRRREVY